ncbi:MAG: sensor of ECF-type sigma factor [Bacteroidia bacterium]|nr:sensor of ECF-type sigma factor [Bacteroidia bacterium]NND25054.1 sensor of ECF-type sigma factor [Flavobacteriaceae bacterium]MBT8279392.1 sensor of ECF-type sigma factor [Bacteroidia bacterium]NNK59392.1 sensor of ECF-type sigma factor [Flavobacteriaceae bacterium]NNL33800.1 sensor of ECF-type sigma factor [Flavobacteriaceae bacterium]
MKKIIIPIIMLLMCFSAWSQNDRQMNERIKAQKVAFITERLDLTSKEAQQFWPIYNAYEDKIDEMRKNDLKEVRQAMRKGNLSKEEAQRLLDQFMSVENRMHEAKNQLVEDLSNVIPPQKIIQLKVSEDAFNRRLMEILQERKKKMQQARDNRNNRNLP